MHRPRCCLVTAAFALSLTLPRAHGADEAMWVPVLDGGFWQIADDDPSMTEARIVDEGTSNVCDFTIYRDAHDLWHAIACVRGTDQPGRRLFYEWTSRDLEAAGWHERREVQWPRSRVFGDKPSSIQAPHAFTWQGKYWCVYNSNPNGRLMISPDGREWKPWQSARGDNVLFPSGRDICAYRDPKSGTWYAYFCGHVEEPDGTRRGAMVARTAKTLTGPWSEEVLVVRRKGNPESPFVLDYQGKYYLFQQTTVYASDTPERFEGGPITHLTGIWYGGKYAPEVVVHEGQYYFAGYSRGLHVAKMKWVQRSAAEIQRWRDTEWKALLEERTRHRR